jgi:hypothetical protein
VFIVVLLCRYIMRELIHKQAMPAQNLPPYFRAWLQLSSDLCMYTPVQQKRYATNHLQAGCWYLDCAASYTPDEEVSTRESLDAACSPPVGAREVMELVEEESVQPVRGEGSSQKKKRVTKAQREAAARAAVEIQKQVGDVAIGCEGSLRSSPAVGTHAQFTSSVSEATEDLRGQWKGRQLPSTSTTVAQPHPVQLMLENSSFFAVMETLGSPAGPDPLWGKVHQFISDVSNILHIYHFSFSFLLIGIC